MDDIRSRLIRCFAAVFPQVSEDRMSTATPESTEGWDSVATVTLFAVIQEEFGFTLDFEDLQDLESFEQVYEYLCRRKAC